jgi:hypothetical protein
MAFSHIPEMLKKSSAVSFLRDFMRGFLSTKELLPLTIEDVCRVCPLSRFDENGNGCDASALERIDTCRKRYFATLLQSYLGKPGDEETDWLYSHLKKCESCYLGMLMDTGEMEPFKQAGASEPADQPHASTASRSRNGGE